MGGRGSSGKSKSGGSSADVKRQINTSLSGNINNDIDKIRKIMANAPQGTKLEYKGNNPYHDTKTVFTKNKNGWTEEYIVNGKKAWETTGTATDVWNSAYFG